MDKKLLLALIDEWISDYRGTHNVEEHETHTFEGSAYGLLCEAYKAIEASG